MYSCVHRYSNWRLRSVRVGNFRRQVNVPFAPIDANFTTPLSEKASIVVANPVLAWFQLAEKMSSLNQICVN